MRYLLPLLALLLIGCPADDCPTPAPDGSEVVWTAASGTITCYGATEVVQRESGPLDCVWWCATSEMAAGQPAAFWGVTFVNGMLDETVTGDCY